MEVIVSVFVNTQTDASSVSSIWPWTAVASKPATWGFIIFVHPVCKKTECTWLLNGVLRSQAGAAAGLFTDQHTDCY